MNRRDTRMNLNIGIEPDIGSVDIGTLVKALKNVVSKYTGVIADNVDIRLNYSDYRNRRYYEED